MNENENSILQKIDATKKKSLARQRRMEDLIEANQLGIMDFIYNRLRRAEERDTVTSMLATKIREKIETGDEFELNFRDLVAAYTALDRNGTFDYENAVQLIKADSSKNPLPPIDPEKEKDDIYTKRLEDMPKEEKKRLQQLYEKLKNISEIEKGEENHEILDS